MKFNRSSGILLHPTSLPGPDGIGDLGPEAYAWVDFLAEFGFGLWQVLPLGPTGYGDSPYQCFSAFAGNPLLVSPAILIDEGLLKPEDLLDRPDFNPHKIDYGKAIFWKTLLLDRAFDHFKQLKPTSIQNEFDRFLREQEDWLVDYAAFRTIKDEFGGVSWVEWPRELSACKPEAVNDFIKNHHQEYERHIFFQFLFFRQWFALKEFTNQKGIKLIGDIPIFISHDSSDAWANRSLFKLDQFGYPVVVAGVPPDYFSPTGQLWGNPHYDWDTHRKDNFEWWSKRISSCLEMVDMIRLDHFRGFAAAWEVKFGDPTAERGHWQVSPGTELFDALKDRLGDVPIIAEDLGRITQDVVDLRDQYNFPGMKILQFSFGTDATEPFLPHNYSQNCVAYTGTHDNDTSISWYHSATEQEKKYCNEYLNTDGEDIAWDMIRGVWSSVSNFSLASMQDFLRLDNSARMNYPGRPSGNWEWRMLEQDFSEQLSAQILELNRIYGRTVIPQR